MRTRELFKNRITNPEGLGDKIYNLTHKVGIAQTVDFIAEKTGIDCGCEKRRLELNEKFPYTKKEA